MEDNEYNETFDLSRFIPDAPFEEVIHRFENGRTIDTLKQQKPKNPLITLEEFMKDIPKKEVKPEKMDKEQLKEHLEKLEKQIEEEHVN
jgi:hypothetical protein